MSDFTDEDVRAAVAELLANGAAPGQGMHSWRCEDKERYPEPCTCVDEAARRILAAVLPKYAKRVREDMGLDAEQYRLGWEKGNQRGRVEALVAEAEWFKSVPQKNLTGPLVADILALHARADAEEGNDD